MQRLRVFSIAVDCIAARETAVERRIAARPPAGILLPLVNAPRTNAFSCMRRRLRLQAPSQQRVPKQQLAIFDALERRGFSVILSCAPTCSTHDKPQIPKGNKHIPENKRSLLSEAVQASEMTAQAAAPACVDWLMPGEHRATHTASRPRHPKTCCIANEERRSLARAYCWRSLKLRGAIAQPVKTPSILDRVREV